MTDIDTNTFRLTVSQSAPRLADTEWNAEQIRRCAQSCTAHLLLTPELSLTGYDVRDRVHELALPATQLPERLRLEQNTAVAVGFIEASTAGVPYNGAAIVERTAVRFLHRKLYLPTYGMFDEGRYFGRGERVDTFELAGWRCGLLICEDFWHPALSYLLACQQIELLLVMAAAPGRDAWTGGEHSDFASNDVWERMARTTAQQYGIYVALCNRSGVERAVTFGGGSVVAHPNGSVIGRATEEEPLVNVELSRAELQRARRPYAHVRDELPALVSRELQRITSA